VRRAHHDTLDHGLPADQGVVAAFEHRHQLEVSRQAKKLSQPVFHDDMDQS
jgi:hypothetical protein